uniref:CD72 antigen n=1 Tax=Nannospalax galili TaxID=1026970 RepID=A0A8C6Q9Y7_NANGA
MAEAITYADLRFVKAPLKNSISSCLEQDSEAYEDGELTYENVQVSSVSAGPSGLTCSVLADKTGVKSEQSTTSWSSMTSPAVRRILSCPTVCLQYFLLGLLLACLMSGVAAICLGVRYLQVSQQLQQMTRVLEATNSSLRQQLREKTTQLGQKEEDLQRSRREFILSQEALQEKQRNHEATEQQLQACLSEVTKTKESLKREQGLSLQRMTLNQRLVAMRDTLKRFFSCRSSDTCCPLGWILYEKNCLYVSPTRKTWEESQEHCTSLSSKLATPSEFPSYTYSSSQQHLLSSLRELVYSGSDSYWIGQQDSHSSQHTRINGWLWKKSQSKCTESYPCICELEVFTFPDG